MLAPAHRGFPVVRLPDLESRRRPPSAGGAVIRLRLERPGVKAAWQTFRAASRGAKLRGTTPQKRARRDRGACSLSRHGALRRAGGSTQVVRAVRRRGGSAVARLVGTTVDVRSQRPGRAVTAYRAVVREGRALDQETLLNGGLLLDVWRELRAAGRRGSTPFPSCARDIAKRFPAPVASTVPRSKSTSQPTGAVRTPPSWPSVRCSPSRTRSRSPARLMPSTVALRPVTSSTSTPSGRLDGSLTLSCWTSWPDDTPGFDRPTFAQQLELVHQVRPAEVAWYGVDGAELLEVQQRLSAWAEELKPEESVPARLDGLTAKQQRVADSHPARDAEGSGC